MFRVATVTTSNNASFLEEAFSFSDINVFNDSCAEVVVAADVNVLDADISEVAICLDEEAGEAGATPDVVECTVIPEEKGKEGNGGEKDPLFVEFWDKNQVPGEGNCPFFLDYWPYYGFYGHCGILIRDRS